MLTLDTKATFGWAWNHQFFLETESDGNWIWSDPDYSGDHTIRPFNGTLAQFCRERHIACVRDKGTHTIRSYCCDAEYGEPKIIQGE